MQENLEFLRAGDMSASQAVQAAELAYEAFEDFYELFSSNKEGLISAIVSQLHSYSELNQLLVGVQCGDVVGIASYYLLSEMPARQMSGLRSLLEVADNYPETTSRLRQYSLNFSSPGDAGGYVSRFCISKNKRGSGLGARLLEQAESLVQGCGADEVRLHVKRDNVRALAFYRKAGYVPVDDKSCGYILLGRKLF